MFSSTVLEKKQNDHYNLQIVTANKIDPDDKN